MATIHSCKECKENFPTKDKRKMFCTHRCAAIFHNKKNKILVECLDCRRQICGNSKRKFCCKRCQQSFQRKAFLKAWREGVEKGWTSKTVVISKIIRDYLFDKYLNKCSICDWSKLNPFTKKIPLQVHHADGDAKNNQEDNLQLLCPCCHALTDNFGRRNKVSSRRDRYAAKA